MRPRPVKPTRASLIGGAVLLALSIAFVAMGQDAGTAATDKLRVALFPYIPDAAGDGLYSLTRRLKDDFEKSNPGITVDIRPLSSFDDFYDVEQVAKWLTDKPVAGGNHVVEIDAIILRELHAKGVLKTWPQTKHQASFHAAAKEAVTFRDESLGLPHWLCGHFVFSRSASIANAKSVSSFVSPLKNLGSPAPNLVAGLLGSFNLPAIYIDAWADTRGTDNLSQALSPDLDQQIVAGLKQFATQCAVGENNPCLNGVYDDNLGPAIEFAEKRADSLFGYSERLHFVRKRQRQLGSTDRLYLHTAALGEGTSPTVFVDALVLRADCDSRCVEMAQRFGDYLVDARTFRWILLSEDAGRDAIPRYLIPATNAAFEQPRVKADTYFRDIRRSISEAKAFPNGGLYEIRRKMRDVLKAALE